MTKKCDAANTFVFFNRVYRIFIREFQRKIKINSFNEFCALVDTQNNNNQPVQEVAKIGLHVCDHLLFNLNILQKRKLVSVKSFDNQNTLVEILPEGNSVIQEVEKNFSDPSIKQELQNLQEYIEKIEVSINKIFNHQNKNKRQST